jgi:hypothetical protein
MTGMPTFLAASVATVFLLLVAAAPVEAQVFVNRGFNPRTGRVGRTVVSSPRRVGRVRALRRGYMRGLYNPWVPPPVVVNVTPVINVMPNPWIEPVPTGSAPWVAQGWSW